MPTLAVESTAGGTSASRVAHALFAFTLITFVSAQTVTPAAAIKPAADESTIVLSPFEVSAEKDTGYAAERDLSGTRLNTALRDVAAPVTVLTKEFLDDIGAVNITDAFDFMPNVTYDNLNNDATDGDYARPRIRGLAATSAVMVGFFPEYSDMDRYKLERLGTARGPNAILSGVGDPAGTLTASLKAAGFKDALNLETMFDSWGSARGMIDANRVLIKDRLALRAVVLQQSILPAIQPAYRRDRRIYLTGTANLIERPGLRTTLRANYEWISGRDLIGNGNVPTENVATWLAAGRPTKPNSTGGVLPGTANSGTLLVDIPDLPLMNWSGNMVTSGTSTSVLEEKLFPYDINVKGKEGVAPRRIEQGSVLLQQQVGRNLFIEAAAFRAEELNIWAVKVTGATISADPNERLPNGQPNPNVGKFYVQHDGRSDTRLGTREVFRLQAAYTFDFAEVNRGLGRWLGRHNLFGLYERKEEWTALERLQTVNTTPLPGASANLANSANRVYHRSYLDYDRGVYSFTTYDYRQVLEKNGVRAEALPVLAQTTGLTINDSRTLALQSYFLKDRIVTMVGLRWDESETASGKPVADARGIFPLARTVPTTPDVTNKFKPTNKGVVVHPFEWLSFAYNQSENFKAGASASVDHFGRNLPTEAGEGKDYGVRLNLFDRRFALALNKYETGRVNTMDTGTTSGINEINRIWAARGQTDQELLPFPSTRDTFDNKATGYELSLTFNPTPNWRFYVAGAKNLTVVSNRSHAFRDYVALHAPTWMQSPNLVTTGGNTVRTEVNTLLDLAAVRESQDGVKEFNLREWTGSMVASYSFRQGRLRGLRLSANLRYLGEAVVGTPVVNGRSLPDQAYVEPGYTIAGLGAGYTRKVGRFEGYANLTVKNALDFDGRLIVLARSSTNGAPQKARWIEGASAALTTGIRF